MSESDDNKDLIKRGYEAFAARDIETVMSLFDDDIEWVQPGDSAVSRLGTQAFRVLDRPTVLSRPISSTGSHRLYRSRGRAR